MDQRFEQIIVDYILMHTSNNLKYLPVYGIEWSTNVVIIINQIAVILWIGLATGMESITIYIFVFDLMPLGKSLMYIKKIIGPITKLFGTPLISHV